MKITVELPGMLLHRAQRHCAQHGIEMRLLIETALRTALESPKSTQPFRRKPFGFTGEGPLIHDWPTIRDLAYEGRGGLEPCREQ